MKDNKVLEDPLQDRLSFTEGANNTYKMQLVHCSESDSGTYIARATNGFENATCTAHLIVETCKEKARKLIFKSLQISYFVVAFSDSGETPGADRIELSFL